MKPENHKCYLQSVKRKKKAPEEQNCCTKFLDDDVAVKNDVENRVEKSLMSFYFEYTHNDGEPVAKPAREFGHIMQIFVYI